MQYATLNDREIIPTDDMMVALVVESAHQVGKNDIGEQQVSTVFLRRDVGYESPLWFETMIFGGEHDQWRDRYATYDEAEAGHKRVVEALKSGQSPDRTAAR